MSIPARQYAGALGEDMALLGAPDSRLYAALAELQATVATLQQSQTGGNPGTPLPVGIDNLLRCSDFDHSTLSYTGAGSASELAFWRRGCETAQTILAVGTEPLWDRTQGWLRWSSPALADDLSYAFGKRLVRPGQRLYFQFNARLREAANAAGLQLECGIWDASPGVEQWVSGSIVGGAGLAVTATKVGPAAATTNYQYRVVANTDRGAVLVSNAANVVGAGALDATNYNQIAWAQVTGAYQYRVYRMSPQPGLIGVLGTGATSFNDQGELLVANEPVPAATTQIEQARTLLRTFGAQLKTDWQTFRVSIGVPANYDFSQTAADGQWLRLGLRGLVTPPAVELDRLGLSLNPGQWQPAAEDRNAVGDTPIEPVNDGGQGWYNPYDGGQYLTY